MGMNRRFVIQKLEEIKKNRVRKLKEELSIDKIKRRKPGDRELYSRRIKARIIECKFIINRIKKFFGETHEFKGDERYSGTIKRKSMKSAKQDSQTYK